jgi:hypothetical protein
MTQGSGGNSNIQPAEVAALKAEIASLNEQLKLAKAAAAAAAAAAGGSAAGATTVSLESSEKYGKYFKMKKARVPLPAIKMKMEAAGLDPEMIEKDGNSPAPGGASAAAGAAAPVVTLEQSEEYGKFFKMKKVS